MVVTVAETVTVTVLADPEAVVVTVDAASVIVTVLADPEEIAAQVEPCVTVTVVAIWELESTLATVSVVVTVIVFSTFWLLGV